MLSSVEYKPPIRKNKQTAVGRVKNFISDSLFNAKNLFGQLYKSSCPAQAISHWSPPAESQRPNVWMKWPFEEVVKQEFLPVKIGDAFGPTWATHWFKVELRIPDEWAESLDKKCEAHFRWNSNSEALLYSESGSVLQGLSFMNTGRNFYVLTEAEKKDASSRSITFFVEMACNEDFGAGGDKFLTPPNETRTYKLEKADLALFNQEAYKLLMDLEVLGDIGRLCQEDNPRTWEALFVANQMVNLIQGGEYSAASKLSDVYLHQQANGQGTHQIIALGNCHIDSAWLWPVDETIRKCARSWSNTLALMDRYPEFTFVCSQAQQFAWVKEWYPELYLRIKQRIAEGRFIPVGGTWIEMDGNIPSGESFIRQFLHGQKFFEEEFNMRCQEFWLPDTFGYSPQIPQMIRHMGMRYFLTQKLSWSLVNKFPHNSFIWEGLDGTQVLSHFPPSNSYVDQIKIENIQELMKNLKDKGRVSTSVMLYGFGDGGGGPTADMIERSRRVEDVNGLPRLKLASPSEFWASMEEEQKNLCTWVGELYLELHNGTYTTQAEIKSLNRRCEVALREAEALISILMMRRKASDEKICHFRTQLDSLWKVVLLNQFHDILPGSSIERVNIRARDDLNDSLSQISNIITEAGLALCGGVDSKHGKQSVYFNSLPWPREVLVPHGLLSIPPFAFASEDQANPISPDDKEEFKVVSNADGSFLIKNKILEAIIEPTGKVRSLVHRRSGRNGIAEGSFANELCLYEDIPLFWDAWDVMDYHLETRVVLNESTVAGKMVTSLEKIQLIEDTSLRKVLGWKMVFGEARSVLKQQIVLEVSSPVLVFESEVEWKETHRLLKVESSFDILTREVYYDSQFGHIARPNHSNTSWDAAKYEVVGHKWAAVSEANFGAAVLSDSKYGWNGNGKKLSLSLLRSPKNPDGNADMGSHSFRHGLFLFDGTFQSSGLIRVGFEFNVAVQKWINACCVPVGESFLVSSNPAVVIDTVKPAQNFAQRAIVLRCYEAFGGKNTTRISLGFGVGSIRECNGMEEIIDNEPIKAEYPGGTSQPTFSAIFKPFQIKSYIIKLP